MAEDFGASGYEKAFSPSEPPHPSGLSPLTGPKPRHLPQSYGSPLPSEHPTPYTGLDTNLIPPQPFYGVWPPPEHPPWRPTQMTTPNTPSASIPTSNARLFQGGSDNALNNSTASMANRDIWNLSNVHIHLPHALHDGQGPTSLPQLLRQPLSIFSYVLSTFATLIPHTSVTVDSQQYEAPYTMAPSNPPTVPPNVPTSSYPDLNVSSSENNGTWTTEGIPSQAAEAVTTTFGTIEIALLDDLDMSAGHQPRAWYRSPDLPDGLSLDGIYIRKIYPSGHGYPCPNPSPLGPPVRIGDVGELTSTGFTTLANLVDCQLPALQSHLASLALSDVCHEPDYFPEGQSITGGISVEEISHLPGSSIIKDITYQCLTPQGAVLAVTSPAQLHALAGDKTHRLRLWLCEHGIELLRFLDPDRTEPLYVVTGKVTSSSWATATYSEPLPEANNSLVLAHFLGNVPPYQWIKSGTARNRSKSSATVINTQGERASDQCLFLRGFLLTLAPEYSSRQPQHALNIDTGLPDRNTSKDHRNSSDTAKGSEQGNLRIDDVPSLSSVDFYPSHQINKRLLELTKADLAITHDDDWRLGLEGFCNPSMLGLREDITAPVSDSAGLTAEDMHSIRHLRQGNHTASMGEQEESPSSASLLRSPYGLQGTIGVNAVSGEETVHGNDHRNEAGPSEVPQRRPRAPWSFLAPLRRLLPRDPIHAFRRKDHKARTPHGDPKFSEFGFLDAPVRPVIQKALVPAITAASLGPFPSQGLYSATVGPQRQTRATGRTAPASPLSGQQSGQPRPPSYTESAYEAVQTA
ncbi:hypothetical protein BKA70DRAFT_1421785 [Coprinopsis sp. MPI-PUGE-AT-0042]|nr:hypothetical protein BKA70DRAFT_1421785 [Coprinopsis sp. MPI-PUGE-AT-0042]